MMDVFFCREMVGVVSCLGAERERPEQSVCIVGTGDVMGIPFRIGLEAGVCFTSICVVFFFCLLFPVSYVLLYQMFLGGMICTYLQLFVCSVLMAFIYACFYSVIPNTVHVTRVYSVLIDIHVLLGN